MLTRIWALLAALLRPKVCRCGHERAPHTHYRAGSECTVRVVGIDCPCLRWRPGRRL
jgi:hypothetical protein